MSRLESLQAGESIISSLEGEMAAKRPEGVAQRETLPSVSRKKLHPVEPTPSVAFGDISREIMPSALPIRVKQLEPDAQ